MSRIPAQDFFTFILGGSLFGAGIFLFLNQVMVSSDRSFGFGRWGGPAVRHGLRCTSRVCYRWCSQGCHTPRLYGGGLIRAFQDP